MAGTNGSRPKSIDQHMEKASIALARTQYFEAEQLCLKALTLARRAHDFECMSRICLPLQEARRQRRHAACDVPGCTVLGALPGPGDKLVPGRYLVVPPLVGIDARMVRDLASRQQVPVMVLAREPQTRSGRWPMVGVGTGPREPVVVRAQVPPPSIPELIDLPWYLAAQEALGDAAILKAPAAVPADHHVDDLLDLLEAVPDHEKLIQALARACRDAVGKEPSVLPRRRPIMEDAFSF